MFLAKKERNPCPLALSLFERPFCAAQRNASHPCRTQPSTATVHPRIANFGRRGMSCGITTPVLRGETNYSVDNSPHKQLIPGLNPVEMAAKSAACGVRFLHTLTEQDSVFSISPRNDGTSGIKGGAIRSCWSGCIHRVRFAPLRKTPPIDNRLSVARNMANP